MDALPQGDEICLTFDDARHRSNEQPCAESSRTSRKAWAQKLKTMSPVGWKSAWATRLLCKAAER